MRFAYLFIRGGQSFDLHRPDFEGFAVMVHGEIAELNLARIEVRLGIQRFEAVDLLLPPFLLLDLLNSVLFQLFFQEDPGPDVADSGLDFVVFLLFSSAVDGADSVD